MRVLRRDSGRADRHHTLPQHGAAVCLGARLEEDARGRPAKPFPLTTDPGPNPDPDPNPHQVRAARLMHGGMVRAVLRAKVSWFEATPLGRVLNPNPNPSPSPNPNPNP